MFEFNYDQLKAIDAGVEHILKNEPGAIQISGKAGTGKSVVSYEIFRRSGLPIETIAPMAYIGQAAIIMRLKGFPTAKTCHSWLYETLEGNIKTRAGDLIYDEYFGSRKRGLVFRPRSLDGIKAMFIDEGATVPMIMKDTIEMHNIPIIVTGDINQLPPVKDQPAYMYDPTKLIYLNEVMRQKDDSSILYLANRALEGKPIHKGYYGDAIVIAEDELTNDMILQSDMVLCGKNSTRESLNRIIRTEILGYKGTLPNYGEKVICRKNDWGMSIDGIGLANGLTGRVVNQPEVMDMKDGVFYIDFEPDLFNGVFRDIDINYEFFNAPFSKKAELKNRRWAKGHNFDFAYCITTHLSQGAEYRSAIYFEEYLNPAIQNQLNYVGITRAKQKLIIVKKKQIFAVR